MVASKEKAPKKSKRKAPKMTKDNIIKKSKPKSKTKKAKTGVKKKKSKLRQTKLSFEPPTVTPLRPPRGGGRMEYETFSEGSVTFAGSSRQSDASAREHPHRSQFDHSSRSSIPPGCCIVNLQDDMNDMERTSTSTPKEDTESPRLPTMSLSPHLPVSSESDKPTNRRKREYQSTLEELFPIQQPSSTKKKKRVVDTESDSDNLDQIQLESAQESSDFESEAQKSDAEDQESEGQEQESHTQDEISDADSDDDIVGPSTRRRRLLVSSPPRTPSPRHPSGEDPHTDEELSQELRDITSSARKSHVAQRMRSTKSRNKLKSQFQKNLESLRKKKQGLESDSESQDQSESEGDAEDKRGLYDSTSDVDSVGSDDFVVDDEEKLTLEEIMQIPPEFTSVSYQGPQLNFKVVVQGEVYALLHPDYQGLDYTSTFHNSSSSRTGYSREQGNIIARVLIVDNARPVDPYFRIAYKSLERQVTGITDSAISSSSWRPWFIRTLKQRPEFESERVPGDIAICDACNVGKRFLALKDVL